MNQHLALSVKELEHKGGQRQVHDACIVHTVRVVISKGSWISWAHVPMKILILLNFACRYHKYIHFYFFRTGPPRVCENNVTAIIPFSRPAKEGTKPTIAL